MKQAKHAPVTSQGGPDGEQGLWPGKAKRVSVGRFVWHRPGTQREFAAADTGCGAQLDADEKSRRELGWKAAQENRLAWQEKLSNQQHERNRAVETKLVEQMRKNTSDLATNSLLEARMRAALRPV